MARPFVVCVAFILACLWAGPLSAFEIQYPGEDGFFTGRQMVYMITADSKGQNIGKEGIFTFGRDRITIDGTEYYDSVFESPTGDSHFYFRLDPVSGDLIQKGFKIGSSELKVDPAVVAVHYPLVPGGSWSEKTDLTAKDLEIPGLGRLPIPVSAKGVKVETKVSSNTISVPAGTFDTLLVEATFTGSILGIPVILIQRTWLSADNVAVKRNFEFLKPTELLLYEIELSSFTTTPWDVNWDTVVDILDMVIVAKRFGERIEKPMMQNPDVDGSGIVDILDLVKVGVHFGEGYSSAAPAKYDVRSDNHSDYLAVLRSVYQEVVRQSYRVSGDDLVGLKKLLRALDMVLAKHLPSLVAQNALFQSFPNPCNPEVWLPYALATDSPVTISIHNASGQLVRELDVGYKPAGIYTSKDRAAHWDGKNRDGEKVAGGVYFYTIRAGSFSATKGMLVSK